MIEKTCTVLEAGRLPVAAEFAGEPVGAFLLRGPPDASGKRARLQVVSSGSPTPTPETLTEMRLPPDCLWEHVSVSVRGQNRCPTWDEMCFVKRLFWKPSETVIQFHPCESEYVNVHEYVLHLWRQVGVEPLLPHRQLV